MTTITPMLERPAVQREEPRFGQTKDDIRFIKLVVLINGLVPAALLIWDAYQQRLGANPVNFAIRTTGMLTLIFLPLSLLVTPLRKITGLSWLFHARRMLGLFAFFYSLSHFTLFFALDRGGNVSDTFSEMIKRKYLLVGSAGILFMIPLAITSTNYMIKTLGSKNWQALHRLAYLAAIAGVVHYIMLVKADERLPLTFAAITAVLLAYRLFTLIGTRRTTAAREFPVITAATNNRWTGQLRVAAIRQETPHVRTFQLTAPSGELLPFAFLPGQYLTFTLTVDGKKVIRNYTIASSPTQRSACEVTIKRELPGTSSRFFHEQLHVGDLLNVTAPGGDFVFTGENADTVVLLAGGVGITPLISIIRALTAHRWPGHIHMLYCNKTQADIIFRKELEHLQSQFPNLHLTLTLTQETPKSWTGHLGRIDADLLKTKIPTLIRQHYFICGPDAMIQSHRKLLSTLGVPPAQIHFESFGSAPSQSATSTTHTVSFTRSNLSAVLQPGQTILELAEEKGVAIPSDCRSGTCGTCKCRLLSGNVSMASDEALTRADRASGIILACQARATSDLQIDV